MKIQLSNKELCLNCGRWSNRGISIDAIIIKHKKILLIRRGVEPDKGKWGIPGGYVDWDESVDDAVKREVKEELGLNVKSMKFIKQYSNPKRHPKQTIDSAYVVEVFGELSIGDDVQEHKWFSLEDIPDNLAFDHNLIINDYLKKRA